MIRLLILWLSVHIRSFDGEAIVNGDSENPSVVQLVWSNDMFWCYPMRLLLTLFLLDLSQCEKWLNTPVDFIHRFARIMVLQNCRRRVPLLQHYKDLSNLCLLNLWGFVLVVMKGSFVSVCCKLVYWVFVVWWAEQKQKKKTNRKNNCL